MPMRGYVHSAIGVIRCLYAVMSMRSISAAAQALRQIADRPRSAHLYGGVFEWFSFRPGSLHAVAWGRRRQLASWANSPSLVNQSCDASLQLQSKYHCNCSPGGAGWVWDGWDIRQARRMALRAESDARSLSICVGPYAFPKGNFKFLSGAAVRWVVRSHRFERDVRHAARLFGGGVQVPPPPPCVRRPAASWVGLYDGKRSCLDGCGLYLTHSTARAGGGR